MPLPDRPLCGGLTLPLVERRLRKCGAIASDASFAASQFPAGLQPSGLLRTRLAFSPGYEMNGFHSPRELPRCATTV